MAWAETSAASDLTAPANTHILGHFTLQFHASTMKRIQARRKVGLLRLHDGQEVSSSVHRAL